MINPVQLSWFFAVLGTFIWACMNILDKYVISKKVKNTLSYAFIVASVNILIGIIFALFLDWSNISLNNILYPALAGITLCCAFYAYFMLLSREDASTVIGLLYFYPILVAVLSYFILKEVLKLSGYFGVFLILAGVAILSLKIDKLKSTSSLFLLAMIIVFTALNEFIVKIATINIPTTNGIALNCIFFGLGFYPLLLRKDIRSGISNELKNIKWAFLNETFTFFGTATLYLAMKNLPATIVSSVGAAQPLGVLVIENIMWIFGIRISKEMNIKKKIVPIVLIVVGVVLLYL